MNQDQGVPGAKWLQAVSVEEFAWAIHSYGEEDYGHFMSTKRLGDVVKRARRYSKAREDDRLGVRERVREVADREAWHPVDRVDDLDDVLVDSS